MSQEDDLRGLAKVIDFMRAISILFVWIRTPLFIAMDQTLCCFVLRLVMSGYTWREGRENYMEKHYNTSSCGFHLFLA